MSNSALVLLALPALLVLSGCEGGQERRASFVEVGAVSGLGFRHTSGAVGDYFLIETMGAGGAFLDYDLDGWQDIYLVDGFDLSAWRQDLRPINVVAEDEKGFWVTEQYAPPLRFDGRVDSALLSLRQGAGAKTTRNHLYRNRGDGTFLLTDGAADPGYGMGCAVGDYDNDGDPDLYIANYGANALYRNDRDAGLAEVAATAAVADPHWSTSAAFFDYDNDGDLDLYVVNYLDLSPGNNRLCGGAVASATGQGGPVLRVPVEERTYCSPRRYNGAPDLLYRNEGEGRFSDVSRPSGVFSPFGKGLGVVAADFDENGHMDLYVANDGMRNFLYDNRGDGTFEEVALKRGSAYNGDGQPEAGMGVAAGDTDGDGDVDLLVTNYSRESNRLYRNDGGKSFVDHSAAAGLHQTSFLPLGFGTFFFDADNDADLDLFVANGHVLDRVARQDAELSYAQPNQFFANDGRGAFADISAASGPVFGLSAVSRGAAYGDYDNDGDVDALVTNVGEAAHLYRNDLPSGSHWLSLRLVGRSVNRDAVGARVRLSCGGRVQTRHAIGGGSYLSASDSRLHFGLGECGLVERIEIFWPDGSRQERRAQPANHFVVVEQER